MAINSSVCSYFFTFAQMRTVAFSQNVSKLFSELKLVTDNLLLHQFYVYEYKPLLQWDQDHSGNNSTLLKAAG